MEHTKGKSNVVMEVEGIERMDGCHGVVPLSRTFQKKPTGRRQVVQLLDSSYC